MAREVTHEERGPAILDESDMGDDDQIYVCQCGLSDSQPFCDGAHNAVADEEDGVVYKYANDSPDGERREVGTFDESGQEGDESGEKGDESDQGA